jgi:hypothetical protein
MEPSDASMRERAVVQTEQRVTIHRLATPAETWDINFVRCARCLRRAGGFGTACPTDHLVRLFVLNRFATSLSASKEPRTLAAQRPASSQESSYLCVLSSPAADVGRIEGLRSQVFGKRQGEYKVEYRIVLPDRGVRWIESRRFISYNSDGQPQRLVGVNIDVTKRKRVEEQQRVLHA